MLNRLSKRYTSSLIAKDFYSEKILKSSDIFELDKFYLLNIWSSWCVPCRQEHILINDFKIKMKLRYYWD